MDGDYDALKMSPFCTHPVEDWHGTKILNINFFSSIGIKDVSIVKSARWLST